MLLGSFRSIIRQLSSHYLPEFHSLCTVSEKYGFLSVLCSVSCTAFFSSFLRLAIYTTVVSIASSPPWLSKGQAVLQVDGWMDLYYASVPIPCFAAVLFPCV